MISDLIFFFFFFQIITLLLSFFVFKCLLLLKKVNKYFVTVRRQAILFHMYALFNFIYDTPGKVQIDHRRWST